MTDPRTTIQRQRKALRVFRRLTFVAAVIGTVYLVKKFEFLSLPKDQCCPLTRFEPGDRLIIDRSPGDPLPGHAVLVQTQSGKRRLCLIQKVEEGSGRVWCVTDNPECQGFSSAQAGWVDVRAIAGRVLLSWEH